MMMSHTSTVLKEGKEWKNVTPFASSEVFYSKNSFIFYCLVGINVKKIPYFHKILFKRISFSLKKKPYDK